MLRKLNLILLSFLLLSVTACTEEDIQELLSGDNGVNVSDSDIISGLKEALDQGTNASVSTLHATDGYWQDAAVRILLPPQAQNVYNAASSIPGLGSAFTTAMDGFQQEMNRAAESAAAKAKPIFLDAILGITIQDGLNIVRGDSTAATTYLHTNTYTQLRDAFSPDIQTALTAVGAQQTWDNIVSTYNPAITTFNTGAALLGQDQFELLPTDLSVFVTEKALDGLFLKVGEEEKRIRKNPLARVTDILKRVFELQD